MKANSETVSWLTSVPATDQNFKDRLKSATFADCEEALKHVSGKGVVAAIERRMKQLFSEGKHQISPRPAASKSRTEVTKPLAKDSAPGQVSSRAIVLGARTRPAQHRAALAHADFEVMPSDREKGAALTAQYHRAVGGMVEVLRFGAMMIEFEASFDASRSIDSTRGVNSRGAGRFAKNTGFKAWLKEHAPEVKEGTAYRLKAVTESIAEQYEQIVGAKVAKQFALPALVTTPADQLPANARAKQLELFDFVSGTSQRSWLDRFKPAVSKGGNTYERGDGKGARKKLTAEDAEKLLRAICQNTAEHLATLHKESAFIVLNDAELDGLVDHTSTILERVKAWRKLGKPERKEQLAERVAKLLAQ